MIQDFSAADRVYMARALQLARAGRGHVSPNPMVGAVIVSADGRIIGEGWHRRFGQGHAEVNAVASVAEADRPLLHSATIYVTLEPCSHYGKTPPCAKLLIDCGIGRVVIASGDPNPKVSGRGVAMLREAGIEVAEGLMADEARALNRPFMTAHTLRRPFVTLKWAQSADGFMDHDRTGETVCVKPSKVIIVDGILIFENRELRELMDIKVYVDTDADIRLARRILRDVCERGRTMQSVITQYTSTVKPMHDEFVEPSKKYADVIIPEGGFNSVAVTMLIQNIRSLIERSR